MDAVKRSIVSICDWNGWRAPANEIEWEWLFTGSQVVDEQEDERLMEILATSLDEDRNLQQDLPSEEHYV